MSLIRFTLAFLICSMMSAATFAQDKAANKQTGGHHVVTNLAEHPVHAMRRRRAIREAARPKTLVDTEKELVATEKQNGLYGQWFVLSGKKDGEFSEAQIGQQAGDVISILPEEDAQRPFLMG